MQLRTRILTLAAASVALSAVAIVAAPSDEVGAQEDQIVMKVATVAPRTSPWGQQLRKLRTYVQDNTGNRVRVKLFYGGSLGGEKSLVRRASRGTLEAFAGSTGALGTLVPELNVLESPYLFSNAAAADRALDSAEVRRLVSESVEARNLRFGLWGENGFRSWFTRERPIRSPSDFSGLTMRSQEAGVHLETYRALGATPRTMGVLQVLETLQRGGIDGFDNSPLFAVAAGWTEHVQHLTVSEHCYQAGIVVFSKTWFDGLPEDIQNVLANVPQSMVTQGRRSVRRMDPVLMRNLRESLSSVHEPSSSETAAFRNATRNVANSVARSGGSRAQALLRAARGS